MGKFEGGFNLMGGGGAIMRNTQQKFKRKTGICV